MDSTPVSVRTALAELHEETGWDFAIRVETGAHSAWSAEIRVTPEPGRRDGSDRSVVLFATGGLSPGDVLGEALDDLWAWMADMHQAGLMPGSPERRPCRYCEAPEA
jgi:hypothetical protein